MNKKVSKILGKIYENHKAQSPKLSIFVGQKLILHHYYIQNIIDATQIRVHKIIKERATHFSQFISAKTTIMLRKSQAQLPEKFSN